MFNPYTAYIFVENRENVGKEHLVGLKSRDPKKKHISTKEAIALLTSDVDLWNKYRRDNPDWHPDLQWADLSDETISCADLNHANLEHARLHNTVLHAVDLSNAKLNNLKAHKASFLAATINNSSFKNADLQNAVFMHADLEGSDFRRANLYRANLQNSTLISTKLQHADLRNTSLGDVVWQDSQLKNGANLRWATINTDALRGHNLQGCSLLLNGHYIRDTNLGAKQNDPYCILKRMYTGPKLILFLLALIVVLLPYFAEIIVLLVISNIELILQCSDIEISYESTEYQLWQVMLGINPHWISIALVTILLLYKAVRIILTIQITNFHNHERDTGYAPLWSAYKIFWYIHRYLINILLVLSIIAFVFHCYFILTTKISIPNIVEAQKSGFQGLVQAETTE